MNPRFQRRIQRYGWDKAASAYERSWGTQVAPSHRTLLEQAALRPGEQVLDVACGSGLVTFPAAAAVGETGGVVATDLSAAMVQVVADDAAARGISWVEARRMGAEALDFEDGRFDAVLCALGLMYVPEPHRAAAEAARVLRSGGRYAVSVWGERRHCGWADIFPIVDSRVQSDVCPLFFGLGGVGALERLLAGAGFTDLTVDRLSVELAYDSDEAALEAAFAGGPVALAYDRFEDEDRASAHADYLRSIASFRTAGGYRIPGEFVVASGRIEKA